MREMRGKIRDWAIESQNVEDFDFIVSLKPWNLAHSFGFNRWLSKAIVAENSYKVKSLIKNSGIKKINGMDYNEYCGRMFLFNKVSNTRCAMRGSKRKKNVRAWGIYFWYKYT